MPWLESIRTSTSWKWVSVNVSKHSVNTHLAQTDVCWIVSMQKTQWNEVMGVHFHKPVLLPTPALPVQKGINKLFDRAIRLRSPSDISSLQ